MTSLPNFLFIGGGLKFHLNEPAVQLLGEVNQWAEKITDAYADAASSNGDEGGDHDQGAKIAAAIATVIELYVEFIQSKDKGTGVKLVSPWCMPTLLWPESDDSIHVDDSQLRWTTTDGQNGWVAEQKMATDSSESAPSVAVFQNKFYCVHRGSGSDTQLWFTYFDTTWSQDLLLGNGISSDTYPGLAAFQDKLYCVHIGDSANLNLYYTTLTGIVGVQISY